MYRYFLLYKPYNVLSQFTKELPEHQTLGDCYNFPADVYPVGRLDRDSEGLLILTNDKKLNHRLLDPKFGHSRTYWVQVEGIPAESDLDRIRNGLLIRIKKANHRTLPAVVRLLSPAPILPERDPPIRFRQNIPTSWLELTLKEGKNRQVRKMCAKIGFPVLRLVRKKIGRLSMHDPKPGQVQEVSAETIKRELGL